VTKIRVRQDIWDLGDEADPWRDPVIVAYAQGMGDMKRLDASDPGHGTNWTNQAAIHEHQGQTVGGRLEDQCQHASWVFLPWHRMYLPAVCQPTKKPCLSRAFLMRARGLR
jgi:tyrosinase